MNKKLLLSIFLITIVGSKVGFSQSENQLYRVVEANGDKVNLVSDETIIENNDFSITFSQLLSSSKDVDSVVELFGIPNEDYETQEKAYDGTILFEYRFLLYDGLKMIFSKRSGQFTLSRIDFVNVESKISSGGEELSLGKSFEFNKSSIQELNDRYSFKIVNASLFKQKNLNEFTDISFESEFLRISIDSDRNINSMSIVFYAI